MPDNIETLLYFVLVFVLAAVVLTQTTTVWRALRIAERERHHAQRHAAENKVLRAAIRGLRAQRNATLDEHYATTPAAQDAPTAVLPVLGNGHRSGLRLVDGDAT